MQPAARPNGPPPSVKIYNAVYSSVQVYECMVRGIAVMRRRNDGFVNATQILKVAGVDKGRRTKILEKEILPGKHEIVQGGYGKYQGTWIPLERGRELALQYGIAPLLSPLFDFVPTQQGMGGVSLPAHWPAAAGFAGPRQLSGSASYPNIAPIVPGSALRLLNQGRAQGLFTPSTSNLITRAGPNTYIHGLIPYPSSQPSPSGSSQEPTLKRTRTDSEIDLMRSPTTQNGSTSAGPAPDSSIDETSRPPSSAPAEMQANGGDDPSPSKRARTDPLQGAHALELESTIQAAIHSMSQRPFSATPQPQANGIQRTGSSSSTGASRGANGSADASPPIRLASKPPYVRNKDKMEPLRSNKRNAIVSAIVQGESTDVVLNHIKDASYPFPQRNPEATALDLDIILDDLGHTPLHLAASLGRLDLVKGLLAHGADMHRGNYQGETPLIRSVLATQNYDSQIFPSLLDILHPSIRTIDTAKRSILHHAALSAGVKGRAPHARYYLEGTLTWIAQNENAHFKVLVDLQDEHGDTALNIAARVGNKGLVRMLLDVGANRSLGNKLGLRPGDFGVEPELNAPQKAEEYINSMRTSVPLPVQKSQDVIADLTNMIRKLNADFAGEIKSKQDSFEMTNAHVRAATRELAEQRKQIDANKQRRSELDQVTQRIRNVEKALVTERTVDWTGRTEASGKPVEDGSNPAFASRGKATGMPEDVTVDGTEMDVENQPLPAEDTLASLVKMRRMKLYHDRINKLLKERMESMRGSSADKEYMSKKIVALCTGIPIDKVENMIDDLVVAVESESQIVDIGRVYGFMQRVSEGR